MEAALQEAKMSRAEAAWVMAGPETSESDTENWLEASRNVKKCQEEFRLVTGEDPPDDGLAVVMALLKKKRAETKL